MRCSASTMTTASGRPSRTSAGVGLASCKAADPGFSESTFGSEVETDQYPLGVREIPDDLANRLGKPALERRNCDDLLPLCQLRPLEEVDDLDGVLALQVLLADLAQVGERGHRPRRLPGDVEPQLPRRHRAVVALVLGVAHRAFFFVVSPCATRARPVTTPPGPEMTSRRRMPRLW